MIDPLTLASFLQMQIDDGPRFFNSFTSWYGMRNNFNAADDTLKRKILAMGHLSCFFSATRFGVMEGDFGSAPDDNSNNYEQNTFVDIIGEKMSFDSVDNFPEHNVAFVGNKLSSINFVLPRILPLTNLPAGLGGAPHEYEIFENLSIPELETAVKSYMNDKYYTGFVLKPNKTTLKMFRTTGDIEDIEDIEDSLPDSSDFHYKDAFDMVKELLEEGLPYLESDGYAKARYVADGDYIEMVSEWSCSYEVYPPA